MANFDLKQALQETGNQPEYTEKTFSGYEFMQFLALVRGRYARSMSVEFTTNDLRDLLIERKWLHIESAPGKLTVRLALLA